MRLERLKQNPAVHALADFLGLVFFLAAIFAAFGCWILAN